MLSSWQEPVTPEAAPWWEMLVITTSLSPTPEAGQPGTDFKSVPAFSTVIRRHTFVTFVRTGHGF